MSEREREAKWVLVPWIISDEMFDAGFDGSDHQESWRNMLAARPPIPPDVWEQMVDWGARALCAMAKENGNQCTARSPFNACGCWPASTRVLRAALGISDE